MCSQWCVVVVTASMAQGTSWPGPFLSGTAASEHSFNFFWRWKYARHDTKRLSFGITLESRKASWPGPAFLVEWSEVQFSAFYIHYIP